MNSRRTPKQAQTEKSEAPDRAEDIRLVEQLGACELKFRWEQEVLEEASQRVYGAERSLMPRQRKAAEEILARRGEAVDVEGEE